MLLSKYTKYSPSNIRKNEIKTKRLTTQLHIKVHWINLNFYRTSNMERETSNRVLKPCFYIICQFKLTIIRFIFFCWFIGYRMANFSTPWELHHTVMDFVRLNEIFVQFVVNSLFFFNLLQFCTLFINVITLTVSDWHGWRYKKKNLKSESCIISI